MVALKPSEEGKRWRRSTVKQERRGGIETIDLTDEGRALYAEAGTPWWH